MSPSMPSQPALSAESRPKKLKTLKKTTPKRTGSVCGFLLFSAEIRPILREENPSLGFGMLSKRIGELWRGLSSDQRSIYDARAKALQDKKKVEGSVPPVADSPNVGYVDQFVQIQDGSNLRDGTAIFFDTGTEMRPFILRRFNLPLIYWVGDDFIVPHKRKWTSLDSDEGDSLENDEGETKRICLQTQDFLDWTRTPAPVTVTWTGNSKDEVMLYKDVKQVLENVIIFVDYLVRKDK